MEIITFNDCRKCGSKPRVLAFGSLHLVTCPECLKETLTDPDLADLAKRWNELNPTRSVGINLSKAFSPIKEIRLTARIDDLDLETEPEDEPEDETDMAPESEPVLPLEDKPFQCSCGGNPIDVSRRGRIVWICNKCGQTLVDKPNNSKLTEEDVDQIFDGHYTSELEPEMEPAIPSGWSHATDFSSFKDPEKGPRDPNIPPVHPIHRCSCGGEPEFYSLLNGPIYFICNKCRKMITGFKPFSEMIADWNKANPLDEPERPNLDPGRGPCTCPGFNSPLQYQVGGDHYRRFSYQPVMFFRETNLDFDRANAIKYLARVGHKGDPVEDLEKAAQYLQFYEVRRMYENSLCEQFVDQIDEVPIRHAIRYLFSGEVTLAKMAIDKVLEMYRKPEAEQ